MKKPKRLQSGDTIATISLSSGLGGDSNILWRYNQGKKQLKDLGFNVVELTHSLQGSDFIYSHPEARAQDLHDALLNPEIKGIISIIGGLDSYRIFEYLDLNIIKNNPKVFIGYSDSTSIHQMFQLAGVVSFYGPCVLVDFAENGGIFNFTRTCFEDVLMKEYSTYTYPWRTKWTSDVIPWDFENKEKQRASYQDIGPIVLQGSGTIKGQLLGGCLEVLAMLRGTDLYPSRDLFKDGLLLLETSEEYPAPEFVERELRTMGVMGNLSLLNGILVGKPQDNRYFKEYQTSIKKIMKEFNLERLPILYNCNFGHTEPKWTLPLGGYAQLDLNKKIITLLESPLS
ncbi:S66 peptidase family protein [Enterococcus gilvus]|uniref:S66 family peptidase n=1 Tax=Enterococcus gilvus TaxID=160453 RepID=UPI00345E3922